MNDVTPNASQHAAVNDATTTPVIGPAPWLSLRGAIAIACFLIAALLTAMLVDVINTESNTGFTDIRGFWTIGFCVPSIAAFVFMGWGIRSRRDRVALAGLALVALAWIVAIAFRLLWGPFR